MGEGHMTIAEDILKDKNVEIITISYDQTVQKACKTMIENKIGAIVVKKSNEYVGMWTERDLLRNITADGFNPQSSIIGDYMTTPLHSVSYDTPLHKLEDMILGLFVRHFLVEKEGQYIGIISIGDVLRANLLEKDQRFKELHSFVSWEYYEDWKWGRKKKNGFIRQK
jgi:CBS domain-containing protein